MNNLQSNDLNITVNILYGSGFELIDGKIEIEATFFKKTHRSKIVPASQNRINIYEEFLWKINKNILKYCRTTNEMIKIECFKTPDDCYENKYQRQKIGYTMIKLNEFQIIGRTWDQSSVLPRNFKLYGSSSNYTLLIILTIHNKIEGDDSRQVEKILAYNLNSEKKIREIKNDLETKSKKKNLGNSICNCSTQTESNLQQQDEQLNIKLKDIIEKLNELEEDINEIIKNNKNN